MGKNLRKQLIFSNGIYSFRHFLENSRHQEDFFQKNDCNVLFKPLLKGLGSVMQYLHRLYLQCFWKTTFWNCNLQFRILSTRCWAQNWMFGKRKFWDDCLVLISSCKKTKTWTSMNMHTRVLAHKNVHRDDDTATFFKIAPSEAKFRKTLSSQKLHWENSFCGLFETSATRGSRKFLLRRRN